ncbi:MAG TPA: MCE family protein [Pseudonocardiaceae bacterium]|jgi:virulence factor Mce-like protein|nr:MCE family protein [Pseudonocardiaceae bacterium]
MSGAITTIRRRLLGLLLIALIGAFIAVTVLFYNQAFTPVVQVSLQTDHAGNEMTPGADVKVRGMQVGTVKAISSTGSGANLTLELQPDKVSLIPGNVSAMLLPKTLFGEKYVDLEIPNSPAGHLANGATIDEDRSSTGIEVETVLDDLMPVLQAVQPQKLSVTLTAVSQALSGRGQELGNTLAQLGNYVGQLNPQLPTIEHDLSELAKVSNVYNQAAPHLLNALNNLTTTSQTLVDQKTNLQNLYGTLTTASDTLTNFLQANENNLIQVSSASVPTLDVLSRYSPEYPCFLKQMVTDENRLNKAFGVGTNQPGLHATIEVSVSRGAYVAGQDEPAYQDNRGPRCYDVNLSGPFPQYAPDGPLKDGSTSPPAADTSSQGLLPSSDSSTNTQSYNQGTGLPNSAAEEGFLAELIAPSLGVSNAGVPQWSSLLVGPLFRGTEVTLK